MTKILEIVTTTNDASHAKMLASELIKRRLAACVQIDGPIESVYIWNDEVKSESEYRVTIKTLPERTAEVSQLFDQLHPYDIPQWIVRLSQESEHGAKYADWARQQTRVSSE